MEERGAKQVAQVIEPFRRATHGKCIEQGKGSQSRNRLAVPELVDPRRPSFAVPHLRPGQLDQDIGGDAWMRRQQRSVPVGRPICGRCRVVECKRLPYPGLVPLYPFCPRRRCKHLHSGQERERQTVTPMFGVKTNDVRRVRNVRSADRSAEGIQNDLDRIVVAGLFVIDEETSKPSLGCVSFDIDVPPEPSQGELLE